MIKTKHVWKEVIKPEDFDKLEDMKAVYVAIYKAIYMILRITLDIRHSSLNTTPKKKVTPFKVDLKKEPLTQSVIKDTDNIVVEEKKEEADDSKKE